MPIDILAYTTVTSADLAEFNPAEFNPVDFNCYNVITEGVITIKAESNTFQMTADRNTFTLSPL